MRRTIALLLSVMIFAAPTQVALAQSSHYRLPTQAEQDTGPAPSFRGGQRMPVRIPPPGAGLGIGTSVRQGSSEGVSPMGESAMLSMGYQVHVLGEVMNPGTYRVAASDRVSEILQRAGGVAQNGSERNIEIRRRGGGITHVDLVAFKLFGKLDQNPYVTDNDTVFVPLRKSVIQVVGAVKRPEFYELKNERTLEEALDLAGGFNAAIATKEPIRVVRFKDGEKKVDEVPIDAENMRDFALESGDVIVVPSVVTAGTKFDYNVASIPGDQVFYPSYEDRVFILGGVAFPGAYPFSPYYTINQYVSLAGGITDRGKRNFTVSSINGKSYRAKADVRVNPGDTVYVKESWMAPAAWVGFVMGLASFGLSTSATILALRR